MTEKRDDTGSRHLAKHLVAERVDKQLSLGYIQSHRTLWSALSVGETGGLNNGIGPCPGQFSLGRGQGQFLNCKTTLSSSVGKVKSFAW